MQKIRVFFQKIGRAKYISHLDMNRCMQRALKRSGLDVWYTEGFHPHMYLNFSLPLSLGYQSECEYMEFRLNTDRKPEDILAALNAVLPEGLTALKVEDGERDMPEIGFAHYVVEATFCGAHVGSQLGEQFAQFLQIPEIVITKRSRKGDRQMDIKPFLDEVSSQSSSNLLTLSACIPAGREFNINPMLLVSSFKEWSGFETETVQITRKSLFNAEKAVIV